MPDFAHDVVIPPSTLLTSPRPPRPVPTLVTPTPSEVAPSETAPTDDAPVGGMALLGGVFFAGPAGSAAAVRRPDGSITSCTFPAPTRSARRTRLGTIPGIRGLFATSSIRQGLDAMRWAIAAQDENASFVLSAPFAVIATAIITTFAVLFAVTPYLLGRLAGAHSPVLAALIEGVVRITILVGYLLLIGRHAHTRQLFAYHGAEHQTIAAAEAQAPLTPDVVTTYPTAHVRCGTNLLATVLLTVTALTLPLALLPASVSLALRPLCLVAGLSLGYELLRYCAPKMDRRLPRWLMAPGLTLQRLTTRRPTLDQLEVALVAYHRVPVGRAAPAAATT